MSLNMARLNAVAKGIEFMDANQVTMDLDALLGNAFAIEPYQSELGDLIVAFELNAMDGQQVLKEDLGLVTICAFG